MKTHIVKLIRRAIDHFHKKYHAYSLCLYNAMINEK